MPSFEQRDSGLWSVRFTTYEDGREKTKRLSGYKTKREAREAYEAYNVTHITRKPKATPGDSFRDLAALYMEHAKGSVKESTYDDYERMITGHILPTFGDKATRDITPAEVLKWQDALSDYSYKYKSALRGRLTSIFRFGARYYDLPNPMEKVDPIRNLEGKKQFSIWSEEEFSSVLAEVKDPIFHAYFRTLYATGMRRGEALALTRADVDPVKREISVCKSLTFKTKGATYKVTTPKNHSSNRKISVSQSLIDELLALPENAFLFGVNGKPLTENTIPRKLRAAAAKAGVKEIRIHDLRHSHASLLISKGVSIVAVAKRLGHSSIEQTLNTYAHLMPSDADRITDAIKDI